MAGLGLNRHPFSSTENGMDVMFLTFGPGFALTLRFVFISHANAIPISSKSAASSFEPNQEPVAKGKQGLLV